MTENREQLLRLMYAPEADMVEEIAAPAPVFAKVGRQVVEFVGKEQEETPEHRELRKLQSTVIGMQRELRRLVTKQQQMTRTIRNQSTEIDTLRRELDNKIDVRAM